jgi:cytoskeletal protein CcmA (bactofilin family)
MAWGNKSSEGGPVSSNSSGMSFIGGEVVVTGNVSGQGDLHIDGSIDGDVACKSLILGASGQVKGNVAAERANIAGTVDGTISVGALTVEKAARVKGDITYQTISIENGAQVDGRLTQRSSAGTGELKLVAGGE